MTLQTLNQRVTNLVTLPQDLTCETDYDPVNRRLTFINWSEEVEEALEGLDQISFNETGGYIENVQGEKSARLILAEITAETGIKFSSSSGLGSSQDELKIVAKELSQQAGIDKIEYVDFEALAKIATEQQPNY